MWFYKGVLLCGSIRGSIMWFYKGVLLCGSIKGFYYVVL